MTMRIIKYFTFIYLFCLTIGCTSYTSFVNYNAPPSIPLEPQVIKNFKAITIQSNDILQIRILSTDALAAQPFNLSSEEGGISDYLVNNEGYIDFPTIGKIELKGLEVEEIKTKIIELITPYFNQTPIVQVRLKNFSVNVNGEVKSPGSYQVNNDRLTLIDAITLAGDFTNYSDRDSILIIREADGIRSFGYVNFNSPSIFESEYFYLQQNDVLYVKPNKTIVSTVRDPASKVLPWVSAGVSLIALLITLNRR